MEVTLSPSLFCHQARGLTVGSPVLSSVTYHIFPDTVYPNHQFPPLQGHTARLLFFSVSKGLLLIGFLPLFHPSVLRMLPTTPNHRQGSQRENVNTALMLNPPGPKSGMGNAEPFTEDNGINF